METSQRLQISHSTHSSPQRLQHERRNDSTTRGNAGRIPATPQCVRTQGWVNGAEPQRHKRASRVLRARPYQVGPAFALFHGVGWVLFARLTNGRRRPTTRGRRFCCSGSGFRVVQISQGCVMPTSGKDIRRSAFRRLMVFGIQHGHRINSVDLDALGWLIHLNAGADDYGNLYADPYLCMSQCAPRRRALTDQEVNQLNQALAGTTDHKGNPSPLIRFYEADDGERYIHLIGFTAIQPAPNGRRVRKHPPCPFEADDQAIGLASVNQTKPGAAGESGADQSKPGEPGNPDTSTPPPEPPPEQNPEPEPSRHPADESAHATQTPPAGSALGVGDGSGHGGGQARRGGTGGNGCLMKLNNEAALSRLGIKGGILGQICRMEGLTPQIIEATHAAVVAPGTARNVTSCLIKRLKDPGKWVGA